MGTTAHTPSGAGPASAAYGSAATTQKADVYQADDSDNRIVDTADAYVYGTDLTQAGTWTDSTGLEQVALYSNVGYGDGKPLDTGYERDLARLANNVRNYRTAVVAPTLYQNVLNKSSVTGGKAILVAADALKFPGAMAVGDELSVYVELLKQGRTSLKLKAEAIARVRDGTDEKTVAEGEFTFVALDPDNQPREIAASEENNG